MAKTVSEIEQKSNARLVAVQALYMMELTHLKAEMVIQQFLAGEMPAEAAAMTPVDFDRELFAAIVQGTVQNRKQIDELLTAHLDAKWPLARLEKPLRAILRAAVAEMLAAEVDTPIIINDYINVAYGFFSGKEPGLVNAVLDKVAKKLGA